MNTIARVHKRARFFMRLVMEMKVNKTSAKSSETEIKTPELNSKISTTIDFDLISQAINNDRKQSIHTSGNVKPNNTRRESFFDNASYIAGYLKHAT